MSTPHQSLRNKYARTFGKNHFMVFSIPSIFPRWSVTLLIGVSYLNQLPNAYRFAFAGIVILFTWVFPLIAIRMYRTINGWTSHQMSQRERRFVPYIINIVCYSSLFLLMRLYRMPFFLSTVIMSGLLIQIVCALINLKIKISTHAAASGGVIGMIIAFSLVFHFDATFWICWAILLSGAVCSSRMILKMHNYSELLFGVIVGFFCGLGIVVFL